jgi:hypothetical protein
VGAPGADRREEIRDPRAEVAHLLKTTWRMRPLEDLAQSTLRIVSVYALRAYVVVALVIVGVKVFSPFVH